MLEEKIVANLYQSIQAAFAKDAAAQVAVTTCARKAARIALSGQGEGFKPMRFMLEHVTRNYADSLVRYFKAAGFDVLPGDTDRVPRLLSEKIKDNGKAHAYINDESHIVGCAADDLSKNRKPEPRPDAVDMVAAAVEAEKLAGQMIARLKRSGRGNVAAALNDRLAAVPQTASVTPSVLVDAAGEATKLTADDLEAVTAFLSARREALLKLDARAIAFSQKNEKNTYAGTAESMPDTVSLDHRENASRFVVVKPAPKAAAKPRKPRKPRNTEFVAADLDAMAGLDLASVAKLDALKAKFAVR